MYTEAEGVDQHKKDKPIPTRRDGRRTPSPLLYSVVANNPNDDPAPHLDWPGLPLFFGGAPFFFFLICIAFLAVS
jgi:hypothetical protein